MAKTTRKSRKPKALGNLAEFSEALKTPLTTVAGWTKHPRWKWNVKAPWDPAIVPLVLRWRADELEKGRPATDAAAVSQTAFLRDQKLRFEIRKLHAQAEQAETELSKQRGGLHDAAACEEEAVRRAGMFRNGVQNIAPQAVSAALSHGLPHEAAAAFQKQIEVLINGALKHLAAMADAQPADRDHQGAEGADPARAVDAVAVG